MSAVKNMIDALDDGSFETKFEGAIDGLNKSALASLMADMEGQVGSIPDQQKRHLFKNGIGSIQMIMDTM